MVVANEKSFGDQQKYIVFDIKKTKYEGLPKGNPFFIYGMISNKTIHRR